MGYLAELDDGPRQVRQGYPGNVLYWWPKVAGVGNFQLASDVYYRILSPSGEDLTGGLQLATRTLVGDPGEEVSRVTITVDTSNTDAYPLGENYRVEVVWLSDAEQRVSSMHFAVAKDPYHPHLSLNDFLEEVADAGQILEGQAETLDDTRTAEQHASVLAVKAWGDVYRWLQSRLQNEGARIVPRLIVPRWKLDYVVIAQALHRMFRAEGASETSASAQLAEDWREEASRRFASLGALDYDEDEDGVVDTELAAPVAKRLRRSW